MSDYFALLDQPRMPWIDPDELKEIYHQKTLVAHPDVKTTGTHGGDVDATFTSLNEAYQVLKDPKQRLRHLLSLEGATPPSNQMVPEHLHDLFPVVAALTQRANLLLEKIRATSNRLSRSLLKPQVLEVQKEATDVRERIHDLSEASLAELRQINIAWAKNPAAQIKGLSSLYVSFAYLTRWSAQLDEIAFQLSLH